MGLFRVFTGYLVPFFFSVLYFLLLFNWILDSVLLPGKFSQPYILAVVTSLFPFLKPQSSEITDLYYFTCLSLNFLLLNRSRSVSAILSLAQFLFFSLHPRLVLNQLCSPRISSNPNTVFTSSVLGLLSHPIMPSLCFQLQ